MVHRGDLTDQQRAQISPLLPEGGGQGGQWRDWRDHRQVLNGILWQARTAAPWRDVPERYGPWKTLHERLRRWSADDTWEAIFEHVKASVQAEETGLDEAVYEVAVDSTVTRAHPHAAGARKKGAAQPSAPRVRRWRPSTARRWAAPGAA
ncbi:transposase [Planobispora rosea]|uniref:Transposase n=1 Tax=Planobispora rosea TaxID=35762 RepID=A0A8J3SBX3_PLARO|nr:transposase [Planobispora rosea]GIH88944.1 transposase [Planobispora rosea]